MIKLTSIKSSSINHVAFILDGNGRWAEKRNLKRLYGHKAGIENCIKLIKNLNKHNIEINEISFYVFSSENWGRPLTEIKSLFDLITKYYIDFEQAAMEENLVIRHYGSRKKLNNKILSIIDNVSRKTKKNKGCKINLFFNYGSRNEIVESINSVLSKKITKALISQNLYTSKSSDPDLIIRTGGEIRLSNFMLWQSAYAELYFTKKLWPDFSISDLKYILINYHKRKRRYGKINNKKN